jgi:hypothetical protein
MPSDRLFPMTAQLELQAGTTGELEPILEEPIAVRCLLEGGLRRIEGSDGREEISTMTAYCHPSTPDALTGSRLTVDGRTWVVLQSRPWRFPGRPVESVELVLR